MKIRLIILLTVLYFFSYAKDTDLEPNLSITGIISSFSTAESGKPATNVINGIDECDLDFWTSVGEYPQFIEIDLGEDKNIQASKVSSYLNRIYQYKVEARESDGAFSIYGKSIGNAGTLSGNQEILVSGTTTFRSTVNGGTWSSSNTSIAIPTPRKIKSL